MPRTSPMEYQFNQYMQPQNNNPVYKQNVGLQGKSVDSLDVVKAMDIPLDGSISYFPLTDGTAIISKQLQMDGTSKTIIYKPIELEEEQKNKTIIPEDLSKEISGIKKGNEALKDNIADIKSDLAILSNNLKKVLDEMNANKGVKK